ncbi:histidine kinase [Nonomuraea sp. NPDC050643]|uniref:sensor histidine kinase n=1 Tax=Nonomuraea sp. NPDC050643 TaxID=3155660 RepID=UPI0033FF9827
MPDPATRRSSAGQRLGAVFRYGFAALPLLLQVVLLIALSDRRPGPADDLPVLLADMGLAVAGLVLLRWRHRWPWQVALATAVPIVASLALVGPALVALTSLATHRQWRRIVPVAVVFWLSFIASTHWAGNLRLPAFYAVVGVTMLGGVTAFGLYLGGGRELDAAGRAAEETAQAQRVARAKLEERLKIAQEMHDVLAHRISLLAMLAGGLAYRKDLSPEQTRETALAIQENAHQSLNELRAVLGTLRREGGSGPEAPQPTLAHLDALFEEVRAAGQRVEVADSVHGKELLPAQTGRHAYRIVQEALTNARKHAPGSHVRAELVGRPGDGLRIRVSNAAPLGAPSGPGGRLGLVGLAERTRMAGGTLTHAVRDGRFVLDARLPWEG